jgi:hypothetical protein
MSILTSMGPLVSHQRSPLRSMTMFEWYGRAADLNVKGA